MAVVPIVLADVDSILVAGTWYDVVEGTLEEFEFDGPPGQQDEDGVQFVDQSSGRITARLSAVQAVRVKSE